MKKLLSSHGFSLIEALITISIVGVLGLGLTNLITRTYRGGAKTQLIGDVKQSAQSSIDKLTKTIREADAVVCYASPPEVEYQSLVVRSRDGKITRFYISPQTQNKNGYIAKQDLTQVGETNSPFCDSSKFPYTSPAPEILTDNSETSAVSVKSGLFKVSSTEGSEDTVSIQLKIGPGVTSSNSVEQSLGETNLFTFETTILLR